MTAPDLPGPDRPPDSDPPLVVLLGEVAVTHGDSTYRAVPGRLDRLVLTRLVLASGRAVTVDTLIESLWGERAPGNARNALQVKVSRLRAQLGAAGGRLAYAQGAYRLDLAACESDVGRFVALVEQAEAALAAGALASARAAAQAALGLWRGDPLPDLADDAAVHAARDRLVELWLTVREAHAEASAAAAETRALAIADLRALLDDHPLRARARLALMRALERDGRRGDALAVYDAGRRLFAHHAGLEPPAALRAAFEQLLADERRAVRRPPAPRTAPTGLAETARWLADTDQPAEGLRLALKGAWSWWVVGPREHGQRLLADLVEQLPAGDAADGAALLGAKAWLGVFGSATTDAVAALDAADEALRTLPTAAWSRQDALAAALIADRCFERGDPARAAPLLASAARSCAARGDEWGGALCGTVQARGRLLAGHILEARGAARRRLAEFRALGDPAGQVLALDVLGYCAEIRGDLDQASDLHRGALTAARRIGSPDWEAAQAVRLGNVATLTGAPQALDDLRGALELSASADAQRVQALARNGLGMARYVRGDLEGARAEHDAAWKWYSATGSASGQAYTAARLALVHAGTPDTALAWARDALRCALPTEDPRALAHSFEAMALVSADPVDATRALAGAAALRQATRAPLPAAQAEPLRRREGVLRRAMSSRFAMLWREATADPRATAASF